MIDKSSREHGSGAEPDEPPVRDSLSHKVYCRCGKPLRVKTKREGVTFHCPDHGIVWRYFVPKGSQPKK
jgi:hypothetical protein